MDSGRRFTLYAALLIATLAAIAACDKNPVVTDDDDDGFTGRDPIELRAVGQGLFGGRFTAEVAATGQWAYTTTWGRLSAPGNTIVIWHAPGNAPTLADTVLVENATTLGDVQISDDGALLVVATEFNPGSIVIFDRSRPDSLVELSRFSSPETGPGVHTVKLGRVNGRHLAFLSVDPGPPRLVIVDITDPANPVQILARVMGLPFIHDVFVRDGLLFTALWDQGLSIWDIGGGGRGGSPEDPVLISNIVTVNGNAHNVWWFHNPNGNPNGEKRYVFVGEEGPGAIGTSSSGDIHVVDISDIQNPREVAFFTVPNAGTHNFAMDESSGVLYAAYYNGGVRALDVRGDLGQCEETARAPDGRCNMGLARREAGFALTGGAPKAIWGVSRVGDRLYASDMLSGVYKIDISPLIR